MAAIETNGLEKSYRNLLGRKRQDALAGVNLSVPAGCAFGMIGPNGAGKTTFIKVLLAMLAASRVKAKVSEEKALAQLLELARVVSKDDGFDLELALPLQFFREHLGSCADPNSKTQPTAR